MEELNENTLLEEMFNQAVAAMDSAERITVVQATEELPIPAPAEVVPPVTAAQVQKPKKEPVQQSSEPEPEIDIKERDAKFLIQTCIDVYGEDYVDVSKTDSRIVITILFPKFTIENSVHATHEITDLYFKISFKSTEFSEQSKGIYWKLSEYPAGRRGSCTKLEFGCGYRHSHLPSCSRNDARSYVAYDQFCLGSGPLQVDFTELVSSGFKYSPDTAQKWEMTVLSINLYVRWESLEGLPYFRMKNILPNTASTILPNLGNSRDEVSFALIQVVEKVKHLATVFIRNNAYLEVCKVQNHEELEDEIVIALKELAESIRNTMSDVCTYITNNLLVIKNTNGDYILKGDSSRVEKEYPDATFKFKGKSKHLIITDYEDDTKTEGVKKEYPHPKFTKFVERCIEDAISTQVINNYRGINESYTPSTECNQKIRRAREKRAIARIGNHSSPYYTRRSTGEDMVSVS